MEKAFFEAVQHSTQQSFLLREFDSTGFNAPYHFHPELELTYIVKGNGKRYTGSRMDHFTDGDLVLLGSNLPHCWKLTDADTQQDARSIVFQFTEDFLGHSFFIKEEMQLIQLLLNRSGGGIAFKGGTVLTVQALIERHMSMDSRFDRVISLLQILQALALSNEYELLDQNHSIAAMSSADQHRLYSVWSYIVENFRDEISLAQVAAVAGMTTNAFCKYFKRSTRKTFVQTVIDFRLSYAIQQLVQNSKPISQIAFESGYNDVSQFHKNFKSKIKVSPLNYRKQFLKMSARA